MASNITCPYCGSAVRTDEQNCPGCGAVNDFYLSEAEPVSDRQPKTIGELKDFCSRRGMPLQKMRFFIDEDYKQPKAFGIYRDGRDVVVYKNKADGSRAIRYRGQDEAFAVNEIYQKMLDECHKRGIFPEKWQPGGPALSEQLRYDNSALPERGSSETRGRQSSGWSSRIDIIIAIIVMILLLRSCGGSFRISGGSSGSYSSSYSSSYSDSSWDDDDDWDWDDDDTDWDSDW